MHDAMEVDVDSLQEDPEVCCQRLYGHHCGICSPQSATCLSCCLEVNMWSPYGCTSIWMNACVCLTNMSSLQACSLQIAKARLCCSTLRIDSSNFMQCSAGTKVMISMTAGL